jgi:hypothetical protein
MIIEKEIERYKKLMDEIGEIEEKIINHMYEIIKIFCKINKCKLDTWYFEDAPEGDMGNLDLSYDSIYYVIEVDNYNAGSYLASDFKYRGCDLSCEMPKDLLFMSLEDIENELTKAKKEHEEAKRKKKEVAKKRREANKKKKAILAASAKKKLTKEEAAALGLK